ncbi:MAG: amidophosphoribosyltransferase, partial [Muribaculaceae bacterium]|nr:amidophosphoribosyltransferase [Muribaculaceae bacterium]
MEQLKHECGVAMIRLTKPLGYYRQRYGTYAYGINKLYLLMEKQHNRGQEAAGVGVVKIHSLPGEEYVYRERALGTGAIDEIFSHIGPQIDEAQVDNHDAQWVERHAPFIGEVYMGHLRYSTTGKSGMSYVHPFLRRNNWRSRNLMLCGNFNMTNVEEIFQSIVNRGMNPRLYSDTIMLLESLGDSVDKENHRLYRIYRNTLQEPELSRAIDNSIDLCRVLADAAPQWDGGYVMCGALGTGHTFTIRDPWGIRPAFYYANDEVVVVASERPVIQTTFGCKRSDVKELRPGAALIVDHNGRWEEKQVLAPKEMKACSFERIYFSRGSDADIYQERKNLGRNLVPQLLDMVGDDIDNTVFSFIPNTAEVAFLGMVEGMEKFLDDYRKDEIMRAQADGELENRLAPIMARKLRVEKIAIKDIKLRTFIAEGTSRNDLAAHVY